MDLVIIGMGELGQAFLKAGRMVEGISIKAYYDPFVMETTVSLPSLATLDDVLHSPVDGYILTAPQDKQLELASYLSDSGKKILIPLPVSVDRASLEQWMASVPPWQVWVIPLPLYYRGVLDLKKQLDEEILGRIGVVEYSVVVSDRSQGWYHDLAVSGGCRYQLLLPLMYEITLLFGKIVDIYGQYANHRSMDYVHCSLRLSNGILVSVEAGWQVSEESGKKLEVSGEKGNIVFDSRSARAISLSSVIKAQPYWDDSLEGSTNDPLCLFFHELVEGNQRFDLQGLLEFQNILDSCISRGDEFE